MTGEALHPEWQAIASRQDRAFGADMQALRLMQDTYDIARARQNRDGVSACRTVPPVAAGTQHKLI